MKYLQSKNQFFLMHDWKKLLITVADYLLTHYLTDRTQKLDSRNYPDKKNYLRPCKAYHMF